KDGPADITLAAAEESAFAAIPKPTEPAPEAGVPLLLRNDLEATPSQEPEPGSAIDRLVLLTLRHGEVGTARVTLHGACAGTPARLGADGLTSVTTAQACLDTDGIRVPVTEEKLEPGLVRPDPGDTAQGSFAPDEPCEPE